jgi:predicted nucleic acid-binding protein
MAAEHARQFVDANVLVYAYDASAGRKKIAAEELLARLWEAGDGCLSVQVLQEFFVTVTAKVAEPLSVDEAADRVREFGAWTVFAPAANDVLRAIELHKQNKLNFWDAMIVHAAAELGCDVLWSEDLSDGQTIRGVRIENPFARKTAAEGRTSRRELD